MGWELLQNGKIVLDAYYLQGHALSKILCKFIEGIDNYYKTQLEVLLRCNCAYNWQRGLLQLGETW